MMELHVEDAIDGIMVASFEIEYVGPPDFQIPYAVAYILADGSERYLKVQPRDIRLTDPETGEVRLIPDWRNNAL